MNGKLLKLNLKEASLARSSPPAATIGQIDKKIHLINVFFTIFTIVAHYSKILFV